MTHDYWSRISTARVQRRRVLASAGGAALGAALLAACGGDSNDKTDRSSLVSQPQDTLKTAKRTGVLKSRSFADPQTLDVSSANNPITPFWDAVYNGLVLFEPGYLKPSQNEIAPDLAESWEYSPDKLQITLKLRQGVTWHNKAPVNGRDLQMDDVMFSWQRFATKSPGRVAVVNSVNPGAPVLSVTATDSKTLVIKLKEPLVYALGLFVMSGGSGVIILPKETDSSLDLRSDMVGTGPWVLSNFTPSVGLTLKRHPGYYDKDWALVDQIDQPIISEYASALAQLKAGNIHIFGRIANDFVTPEDVVPLKQEQPKLSIFQSDMRTAGAEQAFGWLPDGKSPFLDVRVRQAISMSIERDLFIDSALNVSRFQSQGLPISSRWDTSLVATSEGWWLDPKSKDFGPNAKYYQHDVAEAKKLLAAAGYPNGFETVSHRPKTGLPAADLGEIIDGMIAEAGIVSKPDLVDYQKEYIPNFRDGAGQYAGWAHMITAGAPTGGSAVGELAGEYWSKAGSSFRGFSTSGKNDQAGDPEVDSMIEKARVEFDTEKRRQLVFDLQRYLAKATYGLQRPGAGNSFLVAWPCVGNYNVWKGARSYYRNWIDDTKPPFKNA